MNFKEITGLPRSHVVEEFTTQLEKKLSERGDSLTIPKVLTRLIYNIYSWYNISDIHLY